MRTREQMEDAKSVFGSPRELILEARLSERELGLVGSSLKKLRTHDVTLFIVDDAGAEQRLVVIRKPMFPAGVFRAPSGGVADGETIEEGAVREAWEETGLDIALERYLLHVSATFRPAGEWPGRDDIPSEALDRQQDGAISWDTHVFLAEPKAGTTLAPRDTEEIAEARWVTFRELQGPIRDALLRTGTSFFRYRAALTDETVEAMTAYRTNGAQQDFRPTAGGRRIT